MASFESGKKTTPEQLAQDLGSTAKVLHEYATSLWEIVFDATDSSRIQS
jgi:hypothetical protein